LMNKKIVLLFFIQYLFSQNCLEKWLESNDCIIKKNILNISCSIKQDSFQTNNLNMMIEKNKRFKIQYLDKIIISDNYKISNYSKKTNQLYIEKADLNLNKLIYLFSNKKDFLKSVKIISANQFQIKNKNSYNTSIIFNDNCDSFKVIINKNNHLINIDNIVLDSIYVQNIDSLFEYNFKEDEIFKYDFR